MNTLRNSPALSPLFCCLLFSLAVSIHAEHIPLHFDVPDGVQSFSGTQPVTFGVPFPKETLAFTDGVRVVDESGQAVSGQFETMATWTSVKTHVRWLLVDTFAQLDAGKTKRLFLESGPDIERVKQSAFRIEKKDAAISVDTGKRKFTFSRTGGNFGVFKLRDGQGIDYGDQDEWKVELERDGPVRAVIKIGGYYTAKNGKRIAQHITRVRLYANCSFARVYHTLVWLTGDETTISELSFTSNEVVPNGKTLSAVDGHRIYPSSYAGLQVRQVDWNRTAGIGVGSRLDGWIQVTPNADQPSRQPAEPEVQFMALRWPWQQFPVSLQNPNGRLSVSLIGPNPNTPMNLKATDVAVDAVRENIKVWNLRIFKAGVPGNDVVWNGQEALPHVSPLGIAKTWELLLWYGDRQVTPEVKNIFAQNPVLGFAEPSFAIKAELPSPASPLDEKSFPEIETGLKRAFNWFSREQGEYGDFGTWNYGDIQWTWTADGVPLYRYWMNHGKGWSIVPWALWLRSGDRRYWDHGEKNSRHCMDVDMCHVPNLKRDTETFKVLGGQYHYSALHWGYGPQHFSFFIDSEYLPYCWYMTGYERAHDVMLEHIEGIAHWEGREGWMAHFQEDPRKNAGRHLFVMIKNLGVLYEATWDKRIKELLDEVLDLTLRSQLDSGNFPHVKTNHYLDQPLNVAARIYGWEKLGPVIERWHRHIGDPVKAGPTGCVGGPLSLWTSINLFRHSGEKHWLDVAARVARTQVASLVDQPGIWEGLSSIHGHEAGPILRDWPIVMSELLKLPEAGRPQGFLPMPGLGSRLPVPADLRQDGWSKLRHVCLVLDEDDSAQTHRLSLLQHPEKCRYRVVDPSNKVMADTTFEVHWPSLAYASAPVEITIPKDGLKGVYAIELYVFGREELVAPVSIQSPRAVHVIPPGRRNFSAPLNTGAIWLKPVPGETLRFDWPLKQYVPGRFVLMSEAGNILAATRVTQTMDARKFPNPQRFAADMPWGPSLEYQGPKDEDELLRLIVPNSGDWHRWSEISGNRPWVSSRREQWFDPEKFPHPDLKSYLNSP